jgi:predicted nucleic acid-binding protein
LIYWDSSALIKKYLKEDGSKAVLQRLATDPVLATSQLTYAEVHATFARKLREKEISLKTYKGTCSLFEADWQAMAIVRMEDKLLPKIRSLLTKHPLRSADSVHLASALYISECSSKKPLPFACADNKLLQASISEGLVGWNPISAEVE